MLHWAFWRSSHRKLGVILILPFFGWAATGMFFFIKPGYGQAYAPLSVKRYPLNSINLDDLPEDWLETRYLQTVLGRHLLVQTAEGPKHLNAELMQDWPRPDASQMKALIEDAIAANPERYGEVTGIDNATAATSTGVTITLDWNRLSLYQYGQDTRFIDAMYNVHYLKWTGIEKVDRVLGVAGLILLCLMALSGAGLLFSSRTRAQHHGGRGAGHRG